MKYESLEFVYTLNINVSGGNGSKISISVSSFIKTILVIVIEL